MSARSFAESVVLITGGASGVGREIAKLFIDGGATVHVLDRSQDHVNSFLGDHPSASATICDVGSASDVNAALDVFEKTHGRPDILVNNAGIAGPAGPVESLDSDDWDRCIDVNLNGTFYVTKRAVSLMKQGSGGSVINIASNAGLFGCPDRSPYAASKWAMVGLTKTWAMELGPHNIRVNAVCPTSVEGERIDGVIERDAERLGKSTDEVRDIYQRQSSMRTFVEPEDVANMVTFLASDDAARISGQIIAVDGHTETLAVWLDQT